MAAKERWRGLLNAAKVPLPSAHVELSMPAKVDTVPLGRMSLMRELLESPTQTFPLPSTATPSGQ